LTDNESRTLFAAMKVGPCRLSKESFPVFRIRLNNRDAAQRLRDLRGSAASVSLSGRIG
jgi:hypothetical protein